MIPNGFATFALAAFPVLALAIFAFRRVPEATALVLLLGELLLPAGHAFDPPLVPPLDKTTIPALAAFVGVLLFGRRQLRGTRLFRGPEFLLLPLLLGAYFTVRANPDPLAVGSALTLPGLKPYDFVSDAIRLLLVWWLPFHLGRALFKNARDVTALLRLMVVAGLVYSLPVLLEVRLSPQIHGWLYGYSPSEFMQTRRWGGFRPMVLFGHGLGLALYLLFCCFAAVALFRARKPLGFSIPLGPTCWYLLFVLLICKSTGAIVYALGIMPLLAVSSPRRVVSVSALIAVIVFAYPLLRLADLVPTEALISLFDNLSRERAYSLAYRFDMESNVLIHTRERLWFGWGSFGRNFIFDFDSGRPLSVIDGFAVLTLSARGLVGYMSQFGLFLAAIAVARRDFSKLRDRGNQWLVAGLAIIASVFGLDLIINATLFPFLILLLGAVSTSGRHLVAEERAAEAEAAGPAVPGRERR